MTHKAYQRAPVVQVENGEESSKPTCNALPHSSLLCRPWNIACIVLDIIGAEGKEKNREDVFSYVINQKEALVL